MTNLPKRTSRPNKKSRSILWLQIALSGSGLAFPVVASAQTPTIVLPSSPSTTTQNTVIQAPIQAPSSLEQRYPPEVLQCAECRRRLGLPALPGLKSDPSHGAAKPVTQIPAVDRLPPPSPSPILNSPNAAPYTDPDFRSLTPLASAAMQRAGQRRATTLPPTALSRPNMPGSSGNMVLENKGNGLVPAAPEAAPLPQANPLPVGPTVSLDGLPAAVQRQILSELEVPEGGKILSYGFQPLAQPPSESKALDIPSEREPDSRPLELPHPSADPQLPREAVSSAIPIQPTIQADPTPRPPTLAQPSEIPSQPNVQPPQPIPVLATPDSPSATLPSPPENTVAELDALARQSQQQENQTRLLEDIRTLLREKSEEALARQSQQQEKQDRLLEDVCRLLREMSYMLESKLDATLEVQREWKKELQQREQHWKEQRLEIEDRMRKMESQRAELEQQIQALRQKAESKPNQPQPLQPVRPRNEEKKLQEKKKPKSDLEKKEVEKKEPEVPKVSN